VAAALQREGVVLRTFADMKSDGAGAR
jgi:hypothetical protein